MTWEANVLFQMGFCPFKPVPVPKSPKAKPILRLGGSPVTIRAGKLAMDWKQITNPSFAFFSSCLFLCPLKATIHILFPRRSIWFLLSPHYQLFDSLQNASLPSPHCSTLSREVSSPSILPSWLSQPESHAEPATLLLHFSDRSYHPFPLRQFFFFFPKIVTKHL